MHYRTPEKLLNRHPAAERKKGIDPSCRFLFFTRQLTQTNALFLSAKHGPEGDLPKEGQYTLGLVKLAEVPLGSDYNDTVLCPNM